MAAYRRVYDTSPAGWLPTTGISSGTLCSVIEHGPTCFSWMVILYEWRLAVVSIQLAMVTRVNSLVKWKCMETLHAFSFKRVMVMMMMMMMKLPAWMLCWQTWRHRRRADNSASAAGDRAAGVTQGATSTPSQGHQAASQQGRQARDSDGVSSKCFQCWQTWLTQDWPTVLYVHSTPLVPFSLLLIH